MQVSLKYAQEHLLDLVSAANRGEEVEIAAPDQSPVRLLLVEPLPKPKPATGRRILGAGRGEMRVPDWEEWKAIDGEVEREMFDDEDKIWTTPERPRAELFGSLKGKIEFAEGWDSPETNKEIEGLFENSEVFPDTHHL